MTWIPSLSGCKTASGKEVESQKLEAIKVSEEIPPCPGPGPPSMQAS